MTTVTLKCGTCQVCGCTADNPCTLVGVGYDDEGQAEPIPEPCGWFDSRKTLCNNPRCIAEIPIDDLISMFEEYA